VDARGIPLSLVGSGANVHDSKLLGPTLGAIVYSRPAPRSGCVETLCADAGYVGYPALVTSRKRNYQLNVKTRRKEARRKETTPTIKPAAGLSSAPIPGSTVSENCWSASRRRRPATAPCYRWPRL
jgi:hypothetical protein